jgi:chemotaxis protein MotA
MPDVLTLGGLVLGLVAILGGNVLEGGHLSSLVHYTAMLIVLGGTVAATLVQTPIEVARRSVQMIKWVVVPPPSGARAMVDKLTKWCQIARRDGLLGLDDVAEKHPDSFVRTGLRRVVDGGDAQAVRRVLEQELAMREERELEAVRLFEAAGGYAPTIGILGAVLGLIHALENLDDPDALGPSIASAFVATVYGVGLANLFLLPLAGKLRAVIRERMLELEMIIEGIVGIAEMENPRTLSGRLKSYLE